MVGMERFWEYLLPRHICWPKVRLDISIWQLWFSVCLCPSHVSCYKIRLIGSILLQLSHFLYIPLLFAISE